MEILVGLDPGRVMVCSKIGMVYSTPSRKLLGVTGACIAYFRNPRSWQKITFAFNTTVPHNYSSAASAKKCTVQF